MVRSLHPPLLSCPSFYVLSVPDSAGADRRFRFGEVAAPGELVRSLAGDAEHGGDLGDADEVIHLPRCYAQGLRVSTP